MPRPRKNKMRNDKNFRRDNDTRVYVIFDRDNIDFQKFQQMQSLAGKNGIYIGFSIMSFEVWLMAHYEELGTALKSQDTLEKRLSQHIGRKYNKTDITTLNKIAEKYEQAIHNSATIMNNNFDFDNQYTNIGEIISSLQKL